MSRRVLVLLTALGLLMLLYVASSLLGDGELHSITNLDLQLGLPRLDFHPAAQISRKYYESEAARDFCRAHGYTVFQPGAELETPSRRNVYDLFMVNTELDFLEVRLNATYDYVDYFIVVESQRTFQGNEKPLLVAEHWNQFQAYHQKIIYHQLEIPDTFHPTSAWDFEEFQRNAMFTQVFPMLGGPRTPTDGDVLIVADVDEIPRPITLLLLRTCNFPPRLTLASNFYYYSFQFRHTGREWPHPQATVYKGMDQTIRPADLRSGRGGTWWQRVRNKGHLANAAWHCSSCFATVDEFLQKMASFSHSWMNDDRFRNPDRIVSAVRGGRDLWGRWFDTFVSVKDNRDLPPLLMADRSRFRYMLDRGDETAGFTDYGKGREE